MKFRQRRVRHAAAGAAVQLRANANAAGNLAAAYAD
jgi:hypothetical protein